MPLQFDQAGAIAYLKRYLENNKARGMAGEIALDTFLRTGTATITNKVYAGGWMLSPNVPEFTKYRYAAFILPQLHADEAELQKVIRERQADRGFQGLSTFLVQCGVGVIVTGAISDTEVANPDALTWRSFIYQNEQLQPAKENEPFISWPGGGGYARKPQNPWQANVESRMRATTAEQLTALTLRQAFYYGHIKTQLRKPIADPYDVDNFIVSYRGAVMPVEVKEKSPTKSGAFGIDAGRILMMLRMGLVTDSNALYIVREVDESATREFVGFRCITLSNMILGCNWNLQGGGAGMGGGKTQTVMMPGSLFEDFSESNLSEEWLEQNSSLQETVRAKAKELADNIARFLR